MGMIELPNGPKLYTTVEVSWRARVSTGKVVRDIHREKIVASKHGRDFMFSQEQFDTALDFYKQEAKERRNGAAARRARRTAQAG